MKTTLDQYQRMANASSDWITLVDHDHKYQAVNNAYLAARHIRREDMIGRQVSVVWGEKNYTEGIKNPLNRAFEGEQIYCQATFDLIQGQEITAEVTYSPFRDPSGAVTHVVVTTRDITERIKAAIKLKRALQKAEETNRLKTEFLNMISHELRTPLTAIIGNITLLMSAGNLPEANETAEIAADVNDSSRHLLAIINDLMDISKIEAGRMQLEFQPFSVQTIVGETLDVVSPLIKKKSLTLETHYDSSLELQGDPFRIKQILLNLLSNAVKFTERGGKVAIRVNKESNCAKFSVEDTGCGIAKKDLPVIFQAFRQVDGSTTRKAGGTGLGLAISKKLALMHGGDITVESDVEKGSIFTFSLPLKHKP